MLLFAMPSIPDPSTAIKDAPPVMNVSILQADGNTTKYITTLTM
jgi:hypothetical protein